MTKFRLATLSLALLGQSLAAQTTVTVGGQQATFDSGNSQLDTQLADAWTNLQMQIQFQRLRDHPEDAPAAVAARLADHPEVVAEASKEWADQWDNEHPLKSSRERPPTPTDYLDKAVRAEIAREHPDTDARIADLESRIQQLEQQKSTLRPPARTQTPASSAQSTQQIAIPAPQARPKGVSILTRKLDDGRIMMIAGQDLFYFKSQAEADAAADKIRKEFRLHQQQQSPNST
jgi:hypothetical protein